jgi:polyhydroxyalkanoate synthesis regulator phasin
MAEPQDMIVPLLREMRTEIRDLRQDNTREFAVVNQRLEHIEGRLANMREAINGESVLGRYAAAEVEERLEAIEKRLTALEKAG